MTQGDRLNFLMEKCGIILVFMSHQVFKKTKVSKLIITDSDIMTILLKNIKVLKIVLNFALNPWLRNSVQGHGTPFIKQAMTEV